jgi:hypothetical protein
MSADTPQSEITVEQQIEWMNALIETYCPNARQARAILATLRTHAELAADARRYRAFWLDPIPPLMDELGLQMMRYGDCDGAFNKEWCDKQVDSALAAAEGALEGKR